MSKQEIDEKIVENIIEITYCFDAMVTEGKIDLDKYADEHTSATWSYLFREDCIEWAREFEEKYPDIIAPDYYDTIWYFTLEKLAENEWLNDTGYWCIERWNDTDLEAALEDAKIPVTKENIGKLRESCKDIFDDKSERNEAIASMAAGVFTRGSLYEKI